MARGSFTRLVALVAAPLLAACSSPAGGYPATGADGPTDTAGVTSRTVAPAGQPDYGTPTTHPTRRSTVGAQGPAERERPPVTPSDGRPRRAMLSIPAIGLRELPVVPYRGRTDDAAGTRIQNDGVAASPYGPRGGVGPGGVGNYQVTAHRTSSTQAFSRLPSVRSGKRVTVQAGRVSYVYEIRRTRETSFRSARSLAEQRAAVPGRPGATPTRAFLTLSTCATPEDHAEGNYWADELHNPEHRIDKIGVLVRTRS